MRAVKTWLLRLLFLLPAAAGLLWLAKARGNREPRAVTAAREGVLLIGNGAEVSTLDPQLATGQPEHMVFSALFEGLVAPAPGNPDANAPGAAARWETNDQVHWTFHLRPGLKWSDGTPLTARDFAWSYRRLLTPELLGQYASMLYPLRNAQEFHEGRITDFSQVGVEAAGDLVLKLTLTGPMPYLLGMMKHYTWYPVPRHVVERFGKAADRETRWTRPGNLVGNGPFRLKEWRFTHSITVERNPHYWDAAAVRLNRIVFLPIKSDATEERAFRDGQLHATMTMPLPKVPEYRREQPQFFHEDPLLSVYFYRINTTRPPLQDKRVRRALALAIDRESLIRNVLRGGQKPAVGLTPHPESMGYHDAPRVLTFDPAAARRLLAEAGFPEGRGFPRFDILINTSEGHRTIAEAIQEMWKKHLGIPVGIQNQDWQVYLESQRQLDYTVCRAAWVGDYPDPYTFLGIWRTGDGNNETGWSNPRYDELLRLSCLEGDTAKRFALLREAETILLDELPILPVYWYVHTYLMRPELKGWVPSVLEHRCYKALALEPNP